MDDNLELKDSLKQIFSHFPDWVAKYEINGVSTEMGVSAQHHDWGVNQLNSIYPLKDKTVIELGAQEAAHSNILQKFGAKKIVAIEGKISNYVKSCVIKNILNISNAKFYLEDLRNIDLKKFGVFDVCLCSGILYHLPEPQNLIAEISQVAPRILINTCYATSNYPTFGDVEMSLKGKKYHGKLQDEVSVDHPSTGLQKFSVFLFKDDLIQILHDVGYKEVRVLKDWYTDSNPEGGRITIFAQKLD